MRSFPVLLKSVLVLLKMLPWGNTFACIGKQLYHPDGTETYRKGYIRRPWSIPGVYDRKAAKTVSKKIPNVSM